MSDLFFHIPAPAPDLFSSFSFLPGLGACTPLKELSGFSNVARHSLVLRNREVSVCVKAEWWHSAEVLTSHNCSHGFDPSPVGHVVTGAVPKCSLQTSARTCYASPCHKVLVLEEKEFLPP